VTRIHLHSVTAATFLGLSLGLTSSPAYAQVVAAEPAEPIEVDVPGEAPAIEAQVVLQLVVDASGRVESAVVASHIPADTPLSFDAAAIEAVKKAPFRPSTRDGRAVRSRVEYVVVFHAPARQPEPTTDASTPVLSQVDPLVQTDWFQNFIIGRGDLGPRNGTTYTDEQFQVIAVRFDVEAAHGKGDPA